MFLQSRHQLDQVARAMTGIELPDQDVVPGILHGAGAAGEGEQISAAGDAADGA